MMRNSLLILAGCILGMGLTWGLFSQNDGLNLGISSPACRPSAPRVAAEVTERPIILFWGNSLLFDHSWDDTAFFAVNCASQGMTAGGARKLTQYLPDLEVDAIVVAFGSVELVRAGDEKNESFKADMASIVSQLSLQYPNSIIWLFGVPVTQNEEPAWVYAKSQMPQVMNEMLSSLDGAIFFDLSNILKNIGVRHTYDGVHLTARSYAAWQSVIVKYSHRLPRNKEAGRMYIPRQ